MPLSPWVALMLTNRWTVQLCYGLSKAAGCTTWMNQDVLTEVCPNKWWACKSRVFPAFKTWVHSYGILDQEHALDRGKIRFVFAFLTCLCLLTAPLPSWPVFQFGTCTVDCTHDYLMLFEMLSLFIFSWQLPINPRVLGLSPIQHSGGDLCHGGQREE